MFLDSIGIIFFCMVLFSWVALRLFGLSYELKFNSKICINYSVITTVLIILLILYSLYFEVGVWVAGIGSLCLGVFEITVMFFMRKKFVKTYMEFFKVSLLTSIIVPVVLVILLKSMTTHQHTITYDYKIEITNNEIVKEYDENCKLLEQFVNEKAERMKEEQSKYSRGNVNVMYHCYAPLSIFLINDCTCSDTSICKLCEEYVREKNIK